jgi:hypothetical protein
MFAMYIVSSVSYKTHLNGKLGKSPEGEFPVC